MKYEKHGLNKLLKTPIAPKCTKTIYRVVNSILSEGHGDQFIPTWDTTDHFHFACEKCETMLDVLQVDFSPYPEDAEGKQKLYALMLFMACPNCKKTGMRKMYFKPTSFMCQSAISFYPELKELRFGKEPKALVSQKLKYIEIPKALLNQKSKYKENSEKKQEQTDKNKQTETSEQQTLKTEKGE